MKKSAVSSKQKAKTNNPKEKSKKKTKRTARHKEKKDLSEASKKVPRKSRWGDPEPSNATKLVKKEQDQSDPIETKPAEEAMAEEEETSTIKELLNDKEKMVEYLFVAVSGNSLEELIPDYLKKRSSDELKRLCLEELNKMPNDEILQIISGKPPFLSKEQETQTDEDITEKDPDFTKSKDSSDADHNNSELEMDTKSVKIEESIDFENEAPAEVLEEVAKELGVSEGDAELLELEMRARAIRSLLKLKPIDDPECSGPACED